MHAVKNYINILKKPVSYLVDIIYPPRCHICRKFLSSIEYENSPYCLCNNCLLNLSPLVHPLCTICGLPFISTKGTDHLCENCIRKKPYYDLARAPYYYTGPLKDAVQRFKYNSETHLIVPLGGLLTGFAKGLFSGMRDYLIVPVPLHRRRLRERGFNQGLLLAKKVSKDLGFHIDYLSLVRERYTLTQTGLKNEERKRNVRGAFSVKNDKAIAGKKILLVDDVFTTGSTVNECAKTLKKSGSIEVVCLTLARTPFD